MVPYFGDFAEDSTIYLMFNTFTSDDPSASCTITDFLNIDVHIYKNNGLTQRNNAAGIIVSVDFDGITGSHMIVIDTNDNTVAGFWVANADYFVRIEGTTVDGATINAVVGHFSIENRVVASVTGAVGSVTDVTSVWAVAMSDLAQGAPSATASVLTAINYLYEAWRNKTVTSASNIELYDNLGTTIICQAVISDDGTEFTKSEFITGA